MDSNEHLTGDEFDSIIELIITVLFMLIGIFATYTMVTNLEKRAALKHEPDKITITEKTHYAEDPFYFTGYQAYMFAWHMDDQSDENLSWVTTMSSGSTWKASASNSINANQPQDASTPSPTVTIGTIAWCDMDGVMYPYKSTERRRQNFLQWRNQHIVGSFSSFGDEDTYANVAYVLNHVNGMSNNADVQKFFTGQYNNLYMHLDLTNQWGTFAIENQNSSEEEYTWVLNPVSK